MSTYAQKQDMIDRFGETELIQLTDRAEPPVGLIDEAVMDRALEDADGDIDAALAVRYTLPLASVPKILKRAACDIARYYLYDDVPGEDIRKRYEDAKKLLLQLATGAVTLGVDAGDVPIAAATGGAEFNESRRVFSELV